MKVYLILTSTNHDLLLTSANDLPSIEIEPMISKEFYKIYNLDISVKENQNNYLINKIKELLNTDLNDFYILSDRVVVEYIPHNVCYLVLLDKNNVSNYNNYKYIHFNEARKHLTIAMYDFILKETIFHLSNFLEYPNRYIERKQ